MTSEIGILLTNIGSPDQPTKKAVKEYLTKFLSDKRVVNIPSFLWRPILHGIILQVRPAKSAKLYQKIWLENEGSPLLYFSKKIVHELQNQLHLPIEFGTHYGTPSIHDALEKLRMLNVNKILILPLYPQYSATTTAVTFDQVAQVLKKWRNIPEVRMIHDYASDVNYIDAVSSSIKNHFQQFGEPDHLLFSFHGLPKIHVYKGDPYQDLCKLTTQLVTQKLKMPDKLWSIAFQSRLGRAKWLTPYTDKVLQTLPKQGVKKISVICPGFSVDCLETLEEIAIRGKEQFMAAGGDAFHYIPSLNNSSDHIHALQQIIERHIQGWATKPV